MRAFLEKIRPSEDLRSKLDFGFRFYGRTIELVEIRARRFNKPGKTEHAFAKATFVKSLGIWRVYWMRGNLKWHPYEPAYTRSLQAFLRLVEADKHHCFFS